MNEPTARRSFVVLVALVAIAAFATWFARTAFNRPAVGPPDSRQAIPLPRPAAVAPVTTLPTRPEAPSTRDPDPVPTPFEQAQRQDEKITRGLVANLGGGIRVQDVPEASVVAQLRVQAGDVITSVNGDSIDSPAEFARIYREQGLPRQMTVLHNGRELHRH